MAGAGDARVLDLLAALEPPGSPAAFADAIRSAMESAGFTSREESGAPVYGQAFYFMSDAGIWELCGSLSTTRVEEAYPSAVGTGCEYATGAMEVLKSGVADAWIEDLSKAPRDAWILGLVRSGAREWWSPVICRGPSWLWRFDEIELPDAADLVAWKPSPTDTLTARSIVTRAVRVASKRDAGTGGKTMLALRGAEAAPRRLPPPFDALYQVLSVRLPRFVQLYLEGRPDRPEVVDRRPRGTDDPAGLGQVPAPAKLKEQGFAVVVQHAGRLARFPHKCRPGR